MAGKRMHALRASLGLAVLAAVFLSPAAGSAKTIASPAVQLTDRLPEARDTVPEEMKEETERAAPAAQTRSVSIEYGASGTDSYSYTWKTVHGAVSYRIVTTTPDGKKVDSETIEADSSKREYTHRMNLDSGFYIVTMTPYDNAGPAMESGKEITYLCFKGQASLVVGPGAERSGTTIHSSWGYKEFQWFPAVDWANLKSASSRYRFRITDDGVDEKKDFAASVIVDETTTKKRIKVPASKLPVGEYTVKVWAYDDDGTELDVWILHLAVRDRYAIYNYDLIEDLDFEPGEAITRQHAVGSKEMIPYGAVKLEPETGAMDTLTMGGVRLDVTCGGNPFTARLEGSRLVLSAAEDAWRVSQKALHALKRSGIDELLLESPGGQAALATDLEFSGRQYGKLREAGCVSKDFILKTDRGTLLVECGGVDYDLLDSALIPRSAAQGQEEAAS